MSRTASFEVLWYKKNIIDGKLEDEETYDDYDTQTFHTRKSAMKFYEQHKNDSDKYGWWVTHRDSSTWEVIEDIVC